MRFSQIEEAMTDDLSKEAYKRALRTVIWLSLGYQICLATRGAETQRNYLEDARAFILRSGGRKSEASARIKSAVLVGRAIGKVAPFVERLSDLPDSRMVDRILSLLIEKKVTSVQLLQDLATTITNDNDDVNPR